MQHTETLLEKVSICNGDLPRPVLERAMHLEVIAWDIETSGLNWKEDQVATCQIYVPDSGVYVVRITDALRPNLRKLLAAPNVCKVFHHAMFDLRFMAYQWSFEIQNVVCTKIASKILNPKEENHTLKSLLQQHLETFIDKEQRNSDWFRKHLTQEQLAYAAKDVIYLPQLFEMLRDKLVTNGRWSLAEACYQFIPIQVQLEIIGTANVFQY